MKCFRMRKTHHQNHRSESFFCEDCLNGLEANNRYNSIGYGVENNMPEGPRRRARINYKE